jgi:dephospho-CoA kinase
LVLHIFEKRRCRLQWAEAGAAVVVLDIPLMFEKGLEDSVDAVLVVSAPAAVQRQRALARQGMTEDKLQAILQRQVCLQPHCYLHTTQQFKQVSYSVCSDQ